MVEVELLPLVEKPARYLGTEWNGVKKEWDQRTVKMAFAFPDVYEIGMSHLGLKILYGLVNREEDYLMERVFSPWTDMEQLMRAKKIPLFSLESYRSLRDFDLVGFTLQYEMSYTNILNMLDLAEIPVKAAERDNSHPLVIAGGPCAYNPEPLVPFIDLFVIGEGEELLLELMAVVKKHKNERQGKLDKAALFEELVDLQGVYIPSYYRVDYSPDGGITQITTNHPKAHLPVTKQIIRDLDQVYFPDKPIVPFMEVVHDRVVLEVLRGCARGCRFCQAGMVYRPVREKSPGTLHRQAIEQVKETGYDEISLASLSTSDYTCIEPLLIKLLDEYEDQRVGVSLPSLRVDSFSVGLAEQVQRVRKSGLTFAPEAGTQRLRDVINKGVTEENLAETVTAAFRAGFTRVKLYFMIGLPTETFDDLDGIIDMAYRVLAIGREETKKAGIKKPVSVTVSASSFVPKSHTPFQWEPQDDLVLLKEKQDYLKSKLRHKQISFNWHEAELSFVEAVFARGDRLVAEALYQAFKKGCKFDGWGDYFSYHTWMDAFKETEINPEVYANKRLAPDSVLPWDHIQAGLKKEFLLEEYRRAVGVMTTDDCRFASCTDCGVCPSLKTKNMLTKGEDNDQLQIEI
ncbi:MAG: TIGR03960 family B12-binding radical SAM protein [Clostridia bacterium]|nr:TIGR03960 family B12-binding radical SAM protein [Clostridia bacterium]